MSNWFEAGIEAGKNALNPFNRLVCDSVSTGAYNDTSVLLSTLTACRDAAGQSPYGAEQMHKFLLMSIDSNFKEGKVVELTRGLTILSEICLDKRNTEFQKRIRNNVHQVQALCQKLQIGVRPNTVELEAFNACREVLKAMGVEGPAMQQSKFVGISSTDSSPSVMGADNSGPQRSGVGASSMSAYEKAAQEQLKIHRSAKKAVEKRIAAAGPVETQAGPTTAKAAIEAVIDDPKKKRVTSEELEAMCVTLNNQIRAFKEKYEADDDNVSFRPLPEDPFGSLRLGLLSGDLTTLHKSLLVFESLLKKGGAFLPHLSDKGLFSNEIRNGVQAATTLVNEMSAAKAEMVKKTASSCVSMFPPPSKVIALSKAQEASSPPSQLSKAPRDGLDNQMEVRPRTSSKKGSSPNPPSKPVTQSKPPVTSPPQPLLKAPWDEPDEEVTNFNQKGNSSFGNPPSKLPKDPWDEPDEEAPAVTALQAMRPNNLPVDNLSSTSPAEDFEASYEYMTRLQKQVEETQKQINDMLQRKQQQQASNETQPPLTRPSVANSADSLILTRPQRSGSGHTFLPPPIPAPRPNIASDPFANLLGKGGPSSTPPVAVVVPQASAPPRNNNGPPPQPNKATSPTYQDPFAALSQKALQATQAPQQPPASIAATTSGSAFSFLSTAPAVSAVPPAGGFSFMK